MDDANSMVHWFGPTWGAPINRDCPETETPVGMLCLQCDQPIEADDRGVTMLYGPLYGLRSVDYVMVNIEGTTRCAVHIDCHLHSVLPPTSAYWAERHVPKRKLSQECTCRDCGQPASLHVAAVPTGCGGWT